MALTLSSATAASQAVTAALNTGTATSNAAPAEVKPLPAKKRVFRADDIPLEWNKQIFSDQLQERFSGHKLRVDSFYTHPTGETNTALVTFYSPVPRSLPSDDEPNRRDWVELGNDDQIALGPCHGLTTLFEPQDGQPPRVDVVFVHGLGGHPIGSWMAANGKFWPRDFLGSDLEGARVLSFGYEAKLNKDTSTSQLSDFGRQLIGELPEFRSSAEDQERPLFFVGHSYGGTVISWVLNELSSKKDGKPSDGDLLRAIRCATFFGTPHSGMSVEPLEIFTRASKRQNSSMIRTLGDLKPNSELLKVLHDQLRRLSTTTKIRVISCVEQKLTLVPKINDGDEDKFYQPVDLNAARTYAQTEDDFIPIHADHREMAKFDHECEVVQEVEAFCRRLAQIGAKKGTIFRACFSSRHDTKPSTQQQRTLILEEQEGHKRDILTYIEHNLPIGQSESARRICKNLQQKASGVFLWAVVAVKGLRKELAYNRPPMLQRCLDEMPADLAGLYRHILTHGSSDTMLHCLRLVLFSQTPPSPMSLYPLITMLTAGADALSMLSDSLGQRGPIEDRARDFLIDASEGLLEVAGPHASVVRFVHASVSEYLRSDEAISHVWRESPETFEGKGHHVVVGCFRSLIQNVSFPALGTAEHSGYLEYPGWQDDEAGCLERGFGGPVELYYDEHPGQGFTADELFLPNHAAGAAMQYYHADAMDASHSSPHTLPPPQHLPPPDDPVSAAVQYAVENILHHSNAAEKAGISQVAFLQSFPLPQYINLKNTLSADQRQRQEPEPYAADTSLLHVLAGENSPALLTTLLATPSHTNEFDRKDPHTGRTPLATAAAHGNAEVVQLLLASAAVDIEARDVDGRTPLALAAGGGNSEVVMVLLEKAAVDIEAGDDDGRTPLALAAFSGSVEVVRLLLSCQGVRVDARDKLGRTPLSLAAQLGVVQVVDLLFRAGADPGASDAGGRTPLCLAAEEGFPDVCRFLIETCRVDRSTKDVHGASPLDYADWRRSSLTAGERGLIPEFDAVIAILSKDNSQSQLVKSYRVETRQQRPTQQKLLRLSVAASYTVISPRTNAPSPAV
ncbi:hypothetical protein BFW01_g562 [Lasiodiplodia theobromae]|nr:hypothetical protein BFW01_g562 [Lasiodiplodia theobromae]